MSLPRIDVSLDEVLAGAVPFALPLKHRFRGLSVREGMLVKGPSGWGEFAPFDDYDDRRAARWLAAALEASYGEWPQSRRDEVAVNAIVPDVESGRAGAITREAVFEWGARTVKVKVGGALADDEARVVAVRDALDTAGVDGLIRLDANARWSREQASTAMARLSRYGIEYVEQPCAEIADIERLRSECDVPIAVDETIRLADDPGSVRLSGVADFAIAKPLVLGGVQATVELAAQLDVPMVLSGSLDSAVGLSTCLAAAGALPVLDAACGFGTGMLLAADVVEPTLIPRAGALAVKRHAPDLDALWRASDRVAEQRAQWWRERLVSAFRVYREDCEGIGGTGSERSVQG